jgi:uncharacterized membrane protein YeaQ/YmgE (transglycosylase-associated protein family)
LVRANRYLPRWLHGRAGDGGQISRLDQDYQSGVLPVSIALGFVGALLGPWVARSLGLPEPLMVTIGGQPFPVLWSIIGAALFVAIIHLISRRR